MLGHVFINRSWPISSVHEFQSDFFNSVVALFELPWAGRKVETLRVQGVATFRTVMEAVVSKYDTSERP